MSCNERDNVQWVGLLLLMLLVDFLFCFCFCDLLFEACSVRISVQTVPSCEVQVHGN